MNVEFVSCFFTHFSQHGGCGDGLTEDWYSVSHAGLGIGLGSGRVTSEEVEFEADSRSYEWNPRVQVPLLNMVQASVEDCGGCFMCVCMCCMNTCV